MNNCNFDLAIGVSKPPVSHRKGGRRLQKNMTSTKVPVKPKIEEIGHLKQNVKIGPGFIEVFLPLYTASEANGGPKKSFMHNGRKIYKGEHWTHKHKRKNIQKGTVKLILRPYSHLINAPCKILLTRYAPDKLDRFDNLPMAFKYILDTVCAVITGDYRPGRADDSDKIEDVKYDQVISDEYAIKICISF